MGRKETTVFWIGVIHSGKKLPSSLMLWNQHVHFAPLALARIPHAEAQSAMPCLDNGQSTTDDGHGAFSLHKGRGLLLRKKEKGAGGEGMAPEQRPGFLV